MQKFLIYYSEAIVQRPEIGNAILKELREGKLGGMMPFDFNMHVLETDNPAEASAVFTKHIPGGLTWFMATAEIKSGGGDWQAMSARKRLAGRE